MYEVSRSHSIERCERKRGGARGVGVWSGRHDRSLDRSRDASERNDPMSLPDDINRSPTHEDTAADVVDAASMSSPSPAVAGLVARAFWWLAHHAVARPLALAFPVRHMYRFSAWTLSRRNMQA